jgi:hypothetical protein
MARRKFKVVDGMILVAGLALGLSLYRLHMAGFYQWFEYQSRFVSTYRLLPPKRFAWLPFRGQVTAGSPLLAACSLSVLVLHWLKPRIPMRRLVRRPGSACCVAVAFGLVLWIALQARSMIGSLCDSDSPLGFTLSLFDDNMAQVIGTSIAATWAMLVVAGRWAWREADWRGWLGQILGWVWLLLFLLLDFNLGIIREHF